MREAARTGAEVLPVDSEHSAIFQCLQGEKSAALRRILLTASGGPFWITPDARDGHRRRCAGASNVAHGQQDHRGLRDVDE